MCEGCHGMTDYRNAFPDVYRVPKLGEQQTAYIVKALVGLRPEVEAEREGLDVTDHGETAYNY